MGSVYCSNIPDDTSRFELERLFSEYGEIECLRICDSKAFVCFADERAARNAIRDINNMEFGRDGRKLRARWSHGCRRRHDGTPTRFSPTKTLFVFNFDRQVDLKRYFEQYGKVCQFSICRDAAFVQFENQEDATRALEGAHMSKVGDKVLKVDYCYNVRSPSAVSRPGPSGRRSPSPVSRPGPSGRRSPSPVSRPLRGSPSYNRYDAPRSPTRTRPFNYDGRRSASRRRSSDRG